mmetsp:Transcript_29105/g.73080  ORF Transcript_29105/g.73080 Transcript_29105/m.73080 type:complete len:311 (+) Transcript_29105:115-1047(+)
MNRSKSALSPLGRCCCCMPLLPEWFNPESMPPTSGNRPRPASAVRAGSTIRMPRLADCAAGTAGAGGWRLLTTGMSSSSLSLMMMMTSLSSALAAWVFPLAAAISPAAARMPSSSSLDISSVSSFTSSRAKGLAAARSCWMSRNSSAVPAGRHSPSGDTSISVKGVGASNASARSMYASTCSCSMELFFIVCGHCHLYVFWAMSRKASRSNTFSPLTSANLAGVLTRMPVSGHLRLITVERHSISSSSLSPPPPSPCRMSLVTRACASARLSLRSIRPLTSSMLRVRAVKMRSAKGRGSTPVSTTRLLPS